MTPRFPLCLVGLDHGYLLVQRQNIGQRSNGRYREGVDLRVALGVMILDVQEVGRVLEGRVVPVQVAHPLVGGRVPGADVPDVALEVLDVDGVEADNGTESVVSCQLKSSSIKK